MAHLPCPCGNRLWNGCAGEETECYFVENDVLEAHRDDFAFFELQFNGMATEMWKCDVCDRLMVFDDPRGPVSRYMRRVDAGSLTQDELACGHRSGVFFSDQLFNDVAQFTDSWHKSEGEPEYELFGNLGEPDSGLLFTYRLMEKLVFSHARGRFRNWWYADMYDDLLVLYPPFKVEGVTPKPVKAWRRYDQVWTAEG